jgi:S1-C subfamily serine protease
MRFLFTLEMGSSMLRRVGTGIIVMLLMGATLIGATRCHAQEMTRETLEKVKAGAIYIITRVGDSGSTGSGWVIEKDAKGVLVVTNRHVVTNDEGRVGDEIKCVVYPGTDKEKSITAQVVVIDPDEDLAVLRIDGEGLPEPVSLIPDIGTLSELQKVIAVGFPKGEFLRFGARAPGVTLSETTISGLRRFDDNTLASITINGGVTNGNSGGMTVNAKGEVIGVVVAMHAQANNIALIIPISQVTSLFRGKPSRVYGVPGASSDPTKVVIDFYVNCFDPKAGVTQVEFFHGPSSAIGGIPQDRLAMTRSVLPGMSGPIAMQYDKSRAQASCRVTFNAADVTNKELVFQIATTRNDASKMTTPPVAVRVDTKQQFSFSPGYKDATEIVRSSSGFKGVTGDNKPIEMSGPVTDMIVAGRGRYLIVRADEEVAIVDLSNRERVKTLKITSESLIAGGADCFVIYNAFAKMFEKWSLPGFTKMAEFAPIKDLTPLEIALGHSSNGPLFVYDVPQIGVPSGNAKLSCAFLDLEQFKGRVEVFYEGPLPRVQGGSGNALTALTHVQIRAAGDGSCFTMWRPQTMPQGMAVFRNKKVKGKLAIDNEEDTGLYVVPSTDGKIICTALGAKSNNLKEDRMSGILLPCTDLDHILSFSPKGFDLRSTSTGATIQTFDAIFPELKSEPTKEGFIEFFMTLDKRIVCSPHFDMMAISFPGQPSVAISKLGLKIAPVAAAPVAGPLVKITNGTMRTWTDVTGAHQTRAKLVGVSGTGVELEMEKDGRVIKLAFDKLSEVDVRFAKAEAQKVAGK